MFDPRITNGTKLDYLQRSCALVRAARLFKGQSQVQFGAVLGLSQSEVSRIETGGVDPPAWLVMYIMHNFRNLDSSPVTARPVLRTAVETLARLNDEQLGALVRLLRG